jgi:hypothetical protein
VTLVLELPKSITKLLILPILNALSMALLARYRAGEPALSNSVSNTCKTFEWNNGVMAG